MDKAGGEFPGADRIAWRALLGGAPWGRMNMHGRSPGRSKHYPKPASFVEFHLKNNLPASDVTIATSTNGVTFTNISTTTVATPSIVGFGYNATFYRPAAALGAGTDYVRITFAGSTQMFLGEVRLWSALPAWLSPTSVATWNTSTHVLSVTGATSIISDPGSDEPIVEANGSAAVITLDPASGTDIHLGGLSLTNGASATVTSLGSARTVTNYRLLVIGVTGATAAPMFTIDSTSTLNLADNDMAILYGTGTIPQSNVSAYLTQACDGGAWNKAGRTSSGGVTALGYGEASALGLTTFDGVSLGGNAVLVKYTLVGDTQLRGSVGIGSYDTVLSNYGAAEGWMGGDSHYGGVVGISDFDAIESNYGKALADVLGSNSPSLKTAAESLNSSSKADADLPVMKSRAHYRIKRQRLG
jgi:hypothetical protein